MLKRILGALQIDAPLRGHLSPLQQVNLPAAAKEAALIPEAAAYYMWSYPFTADWPQILLAANASTLEDPDVAMLSVGAFVYFDCDYQPIQINALGGNIGTGDQMQLRFGPPRELSSEWVNRLLRRADLQPVTLHEYLVKKASHFCWLSPQDCEVDRLVSRESIVPAADEMWLPFGGFAYVGLGLSYEP